MQRARYAASQEPTNKHDKNKSINNNKKKQPKHCEWHS